MKKTIMALTLCIAAFSAAAQSQPQVSSKRFADAVNHWNKEHGKQTYERYKPDQFREIADNIVAYQNADGGWPKNLDVTAKLDPDSVKASLKPRHRLSTLDNANVYTQVEYLSNVFELTGDSVYSNSARRGMEYMLATQYPNGGWRGWDADAVTFNDGIIYGVLSTWQEVLTGKSLYAWVDDGLKSRIRASWDRGIELILKTQWVQDGVKTVWAQQYDHETLRPVKARAYELPALSASESADIVMLLMRIKKPSPEVVEAVKAAAAWFDRTKITGKKVETVSVPGGLAEDPKIKKDRVLVDDPEAAPIWPRYSELSDNRPFFATREGVKVYDLREVPAERRVGYSWYGTWGGKVLISIPSGSGNSENNLCLGRNFSKRVFTARFFCTFAAV